MSEESNPPNKASRFGDVGLQARSALKGAGAWLSQVGQKAKDAAVVAGQHIDKAAVRVGEKVDLYSQQIGEAYEQRVAREAAAKCEARKLHRAQLEAAFDEPLRESALTQGSNIIQECLTFTGEVQQEIQYADASSPLGRESYGLMMLVNTLLPLLEHGMRQDWKAVTPFEPVEQASAWARNMPYSSRYSVPSGFALLLALEHGWRDAAPVDVGLSALEGVNDLSTPQRRLQAWLFHCLSKSCLAQNLTKLLSDPELLNDWYYPWAALLQTDTMNLLIEEVVLIESQEGRINLPIEHLFDHTSRESNSAAQPLADRVREQLLLAGDYAGRAGKTLMSKASEVGSRVNDSVKTYRTSMASPKHSSAPQADLGSVDEEYSHTSAAVPSPRPSAGANASDSHADDLQVHVNEAFNESYTHDINPATDPFFADDDEAPAPRRSGVTTSEQANDAVAAEEVAVAPAAPDVAAEGSLPTSPQEVTYPGAAPEGLAPAPAAEAEAEHPAEPAAAHKPEEEPF